jgi:hypothetical protein
MMKPDAPRFPDRLPDFLDLVPQLSGDKLLRFKRAFGHAVHEATVELERRALAAQHPPADPDRAVGLEEACRLLGMTKAYLERKTNWERLDGYRDVDRRVKFRLSVLQRHLRQGGNNP